MAGQVQTEINCLPVENTEYRQLMDLKNREAMKPRRETKFLDAIVPGHGAGNPGMLGSTGNFDTFIVSVMDKTSCEISTDIGRKLVGLDEGRLKRPKLLECLRMSSWTCSTNASRNTGTGRSKVSNTS